MTNTQSKPQSASERESNIEKLAQDTSPETLDALEAEFPTLVHEVRIKQLEHQNLPPQQFKQALIELVKKRRQSTSE